MHSQVTRGVIAMFLSAFSFSLMNACVKFLENLSPMEVIFFRSGVMALFVAGFWLYRPPKFKNKKKGGWWILTFRAITGGLSMLTLFYNISTIPLGTASAFSQTMPIYAIIFSAVFLREHIRFTTILACILGFIGVICICDPSTDTLGADNIAAGIIGGVMMAFAFVSLKGLKDYFDESVIIMVFGVTMTLISGILMFVEIPTLSGFSIPSSKDWLGILALGALGTIGQILVTRAYMLAPAGLISSIDYTRILWGVLFGMMLGDSLPNLITASGIVLIILSGTIIALPVFLRDYKQFIKRSKNAI